MDAAIAAQLVLNLVEPQSSGLGGGAFIMHWDGKRGRIRTYDGRETAPKAAKPDRFLMPNGEPRDFEETARNGVGVGVPGVLRALELAHARHGRLAWRKLFQPAIQLAEAGFPVSVRLNKLLAEEGAAAFDETARGYFFDAAGAARPVGYVLKNPDLAASLRAIARKGADVFYEGPIAAAIVDKVSTTAIPSDMTVADIAAYRAKTRAPICTDYRRYKICGMGPPSSGGYTIGQILELVEPFDLGRRPLAPDAMQIIAEAQKLAYADRDRYLADGDFVAIPKGYLDRSYLAARRNLIDPAKPMEKAEAGEPPRDVGARPGADATIEAPGTSHISVVDRRGNAVSMTTTIENAFGARMMVAGFLLNNQLTDFSFRPAGPDGKPAANRVEGRKRPRSSMAPTIILDPEGRLLALTGSPGGSRIILYVTKSIICIIDWGCDAQQAASLANFGSRNGPFEVEQGFLGARMAAQMKARGQKVKAAEMTSGLHIVVRRKGRLTGGADPRREGAALGD